MAYPTTIPVRLFKQGEFAVINGKKYVPERTCLPVYDGKWRNTPRCSLCGELLTDGVLKPPKHCSECGAKVVSE